MEIQIIATSDYTANFFQKPVVANVHSIYRNTINLHFNEQIFALQPKETYLSPVSLITAFDETQWLELVSYCSNNKDNPLSFSFNLEQSEIYQSALSESSYSTDFCLLHLSRLEEILSVSNKSGLCNLLFKQTADDIVFQAIQTILLQAEYAFSQGDFVSTAHQLAKLIGLGIGLTPSGDDFLCGVLATLHKMGLKNTALFCALQQAISEILDRTNDISRRFLDCALQNRFSQAMILFFDEKNVNTPKFDIGHIFEKIGHSSGIDTLCGVFFIMKLFQKYKANFR